MSLNVLYFGIRLRNLCQFCEVTVVQMTGTQTYRYDFIIVFVMMRFVKLVKLQKRANKQKAVFVRCYN